VALRGSLRGDHHQRLPPAHELRVQRAEEGTQANEAIISGNHLRTSSACSEPRYVAKLSLLILSNLLVIHKHCPACWMNLMSDTISCTQRHSVAISINQ
jgi:hypothetical protein